MYKAGFDTGFLLGGKTIFLKKFWYFRTAEQTNSVIIILVIVYSSAIDQFNILILFVRQFIVYINIMQCVRGFARGEKLSLGRGGGGGGSQGSPPSVSNHVRYIITTHIYLYLDYSKYSYTKLE